MDSILDVWTSIILVAAERVIYAKRVDIDTVFESGFDVKAS